MSKKSLAVAKYILDYKSQKPDSSLTPMQLIKLVYVAHGYTLGLTGMPLLDEPVAAWRYGPVVPSVYHAVKQYKSSPIDPEHIKTEDSILSQDEKSILNAVVDIYGDIDGIVLSSATHKTGSPWSVTWEEFGRNADISNDIIENFYKKLVSSPEHSAL